MRPIFYNVQDLWRSLAMSALFVVSEVTCAPQHAAMAGDEGGSPGGDVGSSGGAVVGNDAEITRTANCASTPTMLVAKSALGQSVIGLVVSGTDLFLAFANTGAGNSMTGGVFRVPIRGGPPTVVAGSVPGSPVGLVVQAGSVIVGSRNEPDIFTVPIGGGTPAVLAKTNGLIVSFDPALSSDGSNVYWADSGGVESVPLTGGSVRNIVSTSQQFFSVSPAGQALVLDAAQDGSIYSMPIAGGSLTTLATGQPLPMFAQSCGTDVCWASGGDVNPGALMAVSPGGTPVSLGPLGPVSSLVFDGDNFFATGGPDLVRIPLSGGSPVIMSETENTGPVTFDDNCVYWATGGGIFSLLKSAGPYND